MQFETLYQELAHSTETIKGLLAGVSPDDARLRPAPESWSILEVVCHLYDLEREDFREHLDFILHRQNGEWHEIDPQGWVTARKYGERDFHEMSNNFLAERRKSLDWLKGLSGSNWEMGYKTQFGLMKAGDMFASWVAHDNLHIRQLVELRRARIEKIAKPYDVRYAGEW